MLSGVFDRALHEQSVMAWRRAREERLRSPTGWLSLVDRLILEDGDNPLPLGVITLRDGVARLRVSPGLDVRLDGQPVSERVLVSDEGGPADSLEFAGRRYELFRRGDAFAVRVRDPGAPALRAFSGLEHWPIDPAWRIPARFERYQPMRTTQHQFDIGTGWTRPVPGALHFALEGRPFTFEPVLEEDSGRLFIVFGDLTNRAGESYPAGRFLYADLPAGEDATLDFNLAFNPPCAFTPYATCPVTPPQHRLSVRVAAGEKTWHMPEI
jgi:uncharacterized protein (DUF1684 family)